MKRRTTGSYQRLDLFIKVLFSWELVLNLKLTNNNLQKGNVRLLKEDESWKMFEG
jgi:hypothetical protein